MCMSLLRDLTKITWKLYKLRFSSFSTKATRPLPEIKGQTFPASEDEQNV